MTLHSQQPRGEAIAMGDQPNAWRRRLLLASLPFSLGLTGCATGPRRERDPEGSYCFRTNLEHYRKGPCIREGVPSRSAEADIKRFAPSSGLLTVFVVRQHWMDNPNLVKVTVDNTPVADTLPNTLVRLRLKPGVHTLALAFDGQRELITVTGDAGDLRFVQLRGGGFSWSPSYEWLPGTPESLRDKAERSRLVADVLLP